MPSRDVAQGGTDTRVGTRGRIALAAMLILSAVLSSAPATPTFQAYIDGSTDVDAPTNVSGNDAYASMSPVLSLNDEYPYQNGVADSLCYDVGDLDTVETLDNYEVQAGTILAEDAGQEQTFTVSTTGSAWAHLDLGGYVAPEPGSDSWEVDPGSHDGAHLDRETLELMPSPGSLLIAALGLALISWVRLRNTV